MSMKSLQMASILLADLACFPGMEGSPVQDSSGEFLGMLSCPLSNTVYDAEVRGVSLALRQCPIQPHRFGLLLISCMSLQQLFSEYPNFPVYLMSY